MGLSAAQIARRAHTKKATVEHALRVAATTLTAAAPHKYGLTLDQALVITEFEDAPDLVAALTVIAVKEPGKFEHTAQRLRDERAEKADLDALTATLTDAGVKITGAPSYAEKTITRISRRCPGGASPPMVPRSRRSHGR